MNLAKLAGNGNVSFFERCKQRGLLPPISVFVQFCDKKDFDFFQETCRVELPDDTGRECYEVASSDVGYFGEIKIWDYCPNEDYPINEAYHCLAGRKMSEAVKNGRVKICAGFKFEDLAAFDKFCQEEASFEGQDWKVLFSGRDYYYNERDIVLVGTSLPIKWLDKTPWNTIDLSGDFKK